MILPQRAASVGVDQLFDNVVREGCSTAAAAAPDPKIGFLWGAWAAQVAPTCHGIVNAQGSVESV